MTRRVRTGLALLAVVAAVALMVRLSLWQWDRARARDSLLNYTYAVEWLLFAVLTLAGIGRLALEGRRADVRGPAPADEPVVPAAGGARAPLVGPPLQPGEELEEITWVRLRRRLWAADRS